MNEHAKRTLLAMLTALLTIVLTLGAMIFLVRATIAVAQITHTALRAFAVGLELVLGVLLLLGTIWVATHIAVRLYGGTARQPGAPPNGRPL